jgi:hypothetical protein
MVRDYVVRLLFQQHNFSAIGLDVVQQCVADGYTLRNPEFLARE